MNATEQSARNEDRVVNSLELLEDKDRFEGLRIRQSDSTLRGQVVEVLRDAIVDGLFKPGERLKEQVLCDLTGVSRTSVREALRHLESEGLIHVIRNKGPIVAKLTLDEASRIYEVRGALEGAAGKIFAERATREDVAALVAALASLKKVFESNGTGSQLSKATDEFYSVFLGRCGNDLIASMIRSLSARVVYLRSQSITQPGRAEKSIAEIEWMVSAIARRDPDRARLLCEDHVRQACGAALTVLEKSIESESNGPLGVVG